MTQPKSPAGKPLVTFKHTIGISSLHPNTFHSFYEIYFFLSGNVELVCGKVRQKLRPKDIVVVPAREYHQFIPLDGGENYERCVIEIQHELLGEETLDSAFSGKSLLRLDENNRIIDHLLYLIEAEKVHESEDFEKILPAVATDIVFLIKNLDDCPLPEESGLQRLSVEVIKYINENYKNGINLNKIANAFFVSVSTACHYFKEDFGVSIKQYIIEKKMIEAKALVDKGHKAQDICAALGFENYSTFFRAYKKRYGVSPSGRK